MDDAIGLTGRFFMKIEIKDTGIALKLPDLGVSFPPYKRRLSQQSLGRQRR